MGGIPNPSNNDSVEKERAKLDLGPALRFIAKYRQTFRESIESLRKRKPTEVAQNLAKRLEFSDVGKIKGPQLSPDDVRDILVRMPRPLIQLSKLEKISYIYGGDVIEPVYKADGSIETGNTVPVEDWGKEGEHAKHPERILIGLTPFDGKSILQSALPSNIYESDDDALAYQTHVIIHEFFHTVQQPLMAPAPDTRSSVILEADGERFTFKEWWDDFEKMITEGDEGYVSRYASSYANRLTPVMKRTDEVEYNRALAEQMGESFVAHQLNIISNDEGWTNFKEARPQTWALMDKLCRAKLVSKGDKIET